MRGPSLCASQRLSPENNFDEDSAGFVLEHSQLFQRQI